MNRVKLITAVMASCLGATLSHAQSANAIFALYGSDPQLATAVTAMVAEAPSAAYGFCQASANQGQSVQMYVGAGFAGAYADLVAAGNEAGAREVAQAACSCGANISTAFSNVVGAPVGEVCSSSWAGDYARVKPYLWRLLASGGGAGYIKGMSPN
jgi:hypothetical protein